MWIKCCFFLLFFIEYPWGRSSHQENATSSCTTFLEKRRWKEGVCPIPQLQRWRWPMRSSQTVGNNSRTLAKEIRRLLASIVEERRKQRRIQGFGCRPIGHRPHFGKHSAVNQRFFFTLSVLLSSVAWPKPKNRTSVTCSDFDTNVFSSPFVSHYRLTELHAFVVVHTVLTVVSIHTCHRHATSKLSCPKRKKLWPKSLMTSPRRSCRKRSCNVKRRRWCATSNAFVTIFQPKKNKIDMNV